MRSDQRGLFDSRLDQMLRKFVAYHRANPHVWEAYQRFALQMIGRGFSHYSSSLLINRIRWHFLVEVRRTDVFRLNDHLSPFYARMFIAKFPEHAQLFRTRRQRSADRPAYAREPDPDPDQDEPELRWLQEYLAKL